MLTQNFENIDEQLQNFDILCDAASKKYQILADEVDAQESEGLEINQALKDKLKQAIKDQKKVVDDYNTFLVSCVNNKVDLTNRWLQLGFSHAEIQKMNEQ